MSTPQHKIGPFSASLVVSVADYEPGVDGYSIDLNGPTNDSKAIAEVLAAPVRRRRGRILRLLRRLFRPRRRIRGKAPHSRIKDEGADKASVSKAFSDLCEAIQPGQTGLFYFSGHGTQIADATGTEADGLTECLCPYDTLSGNLLTDDEVRATISERLHPRAKLLMLIDCCHSGGQARSIERQRGVDLEGIVGFSKDFNFDDRLHPGVVLLTASKPDEVAWERVYEGRPMGAFTYHLLPHLRAIVDGSETDLTAVHSDLIGKLYDPNVPNGSGSQTPCIESRGSVEQLVSFLIP